MDCFTDVHLEKEKKDVPLNNMIFFLSKKKYELIIKLDEKEIIKMLEYHHNCSQRREGKH